MRGPWTARLDAIENWVRMALSRAGSGDTLATELEYTFVYQPGGPTPRAPNVFADWATMMTAVGKVAGPKLISIDPTFDPTPTVPVGSWNLDDCTITLKFIGSGIGAIPLTFATGALIDPATIKLSLTDSVFLINTGAVVWTIPVGATKPPQIYMEQDAAISGVAGFPFIHVPAGGNLFAFINGIESGIGDGVNPAIQLDAGSGFDVIASSGGALLANSISGAVGATFNMTLSGGAIITQPLGFEPTSVFYFSPQHIGETNAAPITSAAVVFTSTGTIQRESSGLVQGSACASVTGAGVGAAVTFDVLRNPGGVVVATQTVDGGSTHTQCTIPVSDTLPDFAAHTYAIRITQGATALTIAAGQARIALSELS